MCLRLFCMMRYIGRYVGAPRGAHYYAFKLRVP